MSKRSPFLNSINEPFAIHCFAALRLLDQNQQLDFYLYNNIVSYALFDRSIHTVNFACENNNVPVLKYLIEQDKWFDYDGAWRCASQEDCLDVIKYLLGQGVNIHHRDDFALRWASNSGNLKIVKCLVQQGANVRGCMDAAVRWASEEGHLEVVQYLVKHGADIRVLSDMALLSACRNGHLETVKYLVLQGADIHANNNLALRHAASNGRSEIVQFLFRELQNRHSPPLM